MFFPISTGSPLGGPEPNSTPGPSSVPNLDFGPDAGSADLGIDIGSLPDLDPTFPLVSGYRTLGEALARRLETPRGGLFYAPDYGTDLRGAINDSLTDTQTFALQSAIEAECEKDERVLSASAEVSLDPTTGTLSVSISVVTATGPFKLILGISQVSVSVLSVQ